MNSVTLFIGFAILLAAAVGILIAVLRNPTAREDKQKQEEMWQKIANLEAKNSALETEKAALEQERTQMKAERETLVQSCGVQFENMANKIFNQQKDISRTEINNIITPFNKKLEDFALRQAEDNANLAAQISLVTEANGKIEKITDDFIKALLNKPQLRGEWGENALKQLLKDMGLEENKQFFQQVVGENERPDFIVLLPNKQAIIIDAKTIWDKYYEYMQNKGSAQSKELLKAHISNIKKTIGSLSTKKYHNVLNKFYSSLGENMPEEPIKLVLMFVNPEAALSTAIAEDPTIITCARENKVALVNTSTLVSTLQIIDSLWANYTVQQSNEEIKDLAEKLVRDLGSFLSDYKQLGKYLQNASSAYGNTIAAVGETNKSGLLLLAQQLADKFPSNLTQADKRILKGTGFDGNKKNVSAAEPAKQEDNSANI